ncbi:MAG: DUF6492 family protein [Phycisphaerales bacterium]
MGEDGAASPPADPPPAPTVDAIVCVGPGPVGVAAASILGLRAFTDVSRIVVIAAPEAIAPLHSALASVQDVSVRDERDVAGVPDRGSIEAILASRGADPQRAGWYLQQFLKLAAAAEPGAGWRLVWDGDTLPLRPLRLFSSDPSPRPLLAPREDRHEPYFRTLERLIGHGEVAAHSFIHEHLLMRSDLVAAMLHQISAGGHDAWPTRVLAAIDDRDLVPSGFSEFETYGTFVHRRDPSHFALRPLRSTREAMVVLGPSPSAASLAALARRCDLATFEARHRASRRGRWRQRLGLRAMARLMDACRARPHDLAPEHRRVLASMAAAMHQ